MQRIDALVPSVQYGDLVPAMRYLLTEWFDARLYMLFVSTLHKLYAYSASNEQIFDAIVDAALHARALRQLQERVQTYMASVLDCDEPILETIAWAQRHLLARASKRLSNALFWYQEYSIPTCWPHVQRCLEDLGLRMPPLFSVETLCNAIIFS